MEAGLKHPCRAGVQVDVVCLGHRLSGGLAGQRELEATPAC